MPLLTRFQRLWRAHTHVHAFAVSQAVIPIFLPRPLCAEHDPVASPHAVRRIEGGFDMLWRQSRKSIEGCGGSWAWIRMMACTMARKMARTTVSELRSAVSAELSTMPADFQAYDLQTQLGNVGIACCMPPRACKSMSLSLCFSVSVFTYTMYSP